MDEVQPMSVDTGQLTMLQRKLASNALETCPDSVSKFVIVATEGGNSMSYNVQAKPPLKRSSCCTSLAATLCGN